jgi:cation diffusion facilitator family transporter
LETLKEKYKIGILLGWVSIFLNFLLFIFKYIVGIKINSVALKADAWHTLSDSLTSIVMVAGLAISRKPPDDEHPFGHGRAERISSLFIGFMLIIVAISFFRDSVLRLINKVTVKYNVPSILVQSICAILKQILSVFSFLYAKKLQLSSLKADAWHHQSDAITSYIFIVGVALSGQIPSIDSYLGLIISLAILWTAFDIINHNISPLLGENVNEEITQKIQEEVTKIDPRILNLHHFHMHRYGSHVEITFHVRLPKEISLDEAHEISDKIEKSLLKYNLHATVHIEPYEE